MSVETTQHFHDAIQPKNDGRPVIRISRGGFAPETHKEIKRLLVDSATALASAIQGLRGLLYYRAGAGAGTSTIVNLSILETEQDARQMETLAPTLAQRPILGGRGVQFDTIANYEPTWKIEGKWSVGEFRPH